MVRRETYAIGEKDALIHDAFVVLGIDKPDSFVLRIGEIDFAAGVDRQIIRIHTFGDDGFFPVRGKRDNALPPILAGVEPSVRSEHKAISLARILAEDRDFAIDRNLVDTV